MEHLGGQPANTLLSRLKSFMLECMRVMRITKRPTMEELKATVKVSGMGILIIGIIGFLVHLVWTLLN